MSKLAKFKRWFTGKYREMFPGLLLGLDIGDKLIKLTEIDRSAEKLTLKNLGVIETPKGAVKDGDLKDVDLVAEAAKSVIDEQGFESNRVMAAISGEEVISRTIEIPNMPDSELEEAIKWEGSDQIPISTDDAVLDYEILSRDDDGGYNVLIVAVKRDLIDKYLELFELLDLEPLTIEIEPTAAARTIDHLYQLDNIGIIDIGYKTTSVSIVSQEQLLFTRSVGIADKSITEEIADIEGLNLKEAEEFKKNNSLFKSEETNVIIRNLTTAIYRSLDYFQVQNKDFDLDKIVLIGGGSKLIGLAEHFTNEFGVSVEPLKLSNQLAIDSAINRQRLSEDAALLGVSLGLALREEANE